MNTYAATSSALNPEERQNTLLLVDDVPTNLKVLVSYLQNFSFKVRIAQDGEDALEQVAYAKPDLILLDVMMPKIDGFETCRQLKQNPETRNIPVIFMSALSDTFDKVAGFEAGGVDYITKPFQHEEVLARVNTHLTLKHLREQVDQQNIQLEQRVKERTQELEEIRLHVIRSLGRAAEYRDNETGRHVIRMSKCAARLAKALGMDDASCEIILNASPMHDVGKIGIPDRILLKPSKLTAEEWQIMKTHATIGEEILSGNNSELLKTAALVARTHHERWDGSGYPAGFKGEEIPIVSRIVAICDVFDALLSRRPYKDPWALPDVLAYIKEGSGVLFDPHLIELFQQCLDDILDIQRQYADE